MNFELKNFVFLTDSLFIIYNKFRYGMTNNEILKKRIIYRSMHRSTKEMDLLLGNFVKKHIDKFNDIQLSDLAKLLFTDDQVIYKWYFEKNSNNTIPITKISTKLKNFKL